MGASRAGSYEVTPPGRSRASDAAHRADRSTQRQQPTRQAYAESDPTGDATPILTAYSCLSVVSRDVRAVLVDCWTAVSVSVVVFAGRQGRRRET